MLRVEHWQGRVHWRWWLREQSLRVLKLQDCQQKPLQRSELHTRLSQILFASLTMFMGSTGFAGGIW